MLFNRHCLTNRVLVTLCVLGAFIGTAVHAQTTWYVDDDNCPGPGSGTQADPFCSIQNAIGVAGNGDEVLVAPGTYNETIDFVGKAITVRSSDGPKVTTIDATGLDDSVVKCVSGEGPNTALEGFTITGGFGSNLPVGGDGGGGMLNLESSPTVSDCIFDGNHAGFGAGMYNGSGSPTVSNCTFSSNDGSLGGGMYNYQSNTTVTACIFSGNIGDGGGMYNFFGSPTVTNCLFISNFSFAPGGAMYNWSSSATIASCTFTGNTASQHGGAIFTVGASPGSDLRVTNSVFFENSASPLNGGGGAMFNDDRANPVVTNCTFISNTAALGGAMFSQDFSLPVVTNCILWNNTLLQIFDDVAATTVSYSDIEGGWNGLGGNNIDADPLFVDSDNDDYRLSPGSPCIDAADNTAVPKGSTTDFDGNPRFVHDPNTKNTGFGQCPIVDMGAYEFQDGMTECCPADLNGDGVVNPADLAILLGNWGLPGADLNGDGTTDPFDLAILLGNWGPCP